MVNKTDPVNVLKMSYEVSWKEAHKGLLVKEKIVPVFSDSITF